ncbi:hypothetical protein UPYG_G00243850 [Umbra pygmaea]|uniref:Coiled-coil domain containing 171 n=1 Tax=Umbra pygmaea TaxID=75934 RepID=A0ABD0WGN8_UMBPY
MPVEGQAGVTSDRLRHHERTRRKGSSGHSKPFLRASHPQPASTAARSPEDEIHRLNEVICGLQAEQQQSLRGEERDFLGPGVLEELRWRINQLEGDKLELVSRHNEQVSSLESQVARLRAAVERGEAQRQTLEYDVAVARKEAATQRTEERDKMAALCTQNKQLMVHTSELQQRVCDLQKALNITQKAREEDHHALQQEVEERDRLVLSANAENDQLTAENTHLHNLLQEQEKAVQELEKRMGEMQKEKKRDQKRDEETLRRMASELGFITTREERTKTQLEATLQRVKNLEANIESERAAHLESKFNSEIIQLRVRDLEAALQVEKSAQAEAQSSLEMIKQQFREVEKAYNLERERANDVTQRLAQVDRDHVSSRAELCSVLEEEKRATSQLREQLQKLDTTHTHSMEQLDKARRRVVLLEEACESCLTELHSLQLHSSVGTQGPSDRPVCGGTEGKCSPSALVDVLRRTLTAYRTSLDRITEEVQHHQERSDRMVQELQYNQTLISEQKKHIVECSSALSDCNTELQRLRAECSQKSLQADKLQADLQTAQRHRQIERDTEREERGRASELQAELQAKIQKISQLYQRDSQEKFTFLHGLYQRLLAGYVLISQPQCILGSFSWEELCIVITEHVDALTSELTRANERVSHLEGVCESNSVCVTELKQSQECVLVRLEDEVKQQQEAWTAQRHETENQHKHTVSQLQEKIQVYCYQLEEFRQSRSILERERSQLTSDLSNLKSTLSQSEVQRSTLLSACLLLVGALTHLTHTTHTLRMQKALLTQCLSRRAGLEGEVRTLVQALGEGEGQRGGARRWRVCVVCVMAVNRLCMLRRRSRVLFRVGRPGDATLGVCVPDQPPEYSAAPPKGKEDDDGEGPAEMCVRWLRQKGLSSLFLASMAELQDALVDTAPSPQVVLSKAQSSLFVLLDGLHLSAPLTPSEGTKGTLVIRLGQGLHRLTPNQMSCKGLVAALQQHFLVFTQRLHSAEVERRSLRLELANLKRVAKDRRQVGHKNPDIHLVPAERFECVCEELRLALQREQTGQGLLEEQAHQLRLLGDRMDTLSRENQERDRTMKQTVQNLAKARKEVGRKDQALRVVGKHLAGLQQQKQCLEETVRQAENALSTTAKSKDALANYMKTVEFSYRQLRDRIVQCRSTSTGEHLPLQLPKMHPSLTAAERLLGPELVACQSLVGMFSEVYNAACSRIGSLEREISTHQSHVSALRTELQDACLRENVCFLPVCVSQSSMTPPLDDLWQPLVESEAPPTVSPTEMKSEPCQPKTNPPDPQSERPKKSRGSKKTWKKPGPATSTTTSRR